MGGGMGMVEFSSLPVGTSHSKLWCTSLKPLQTRMLQYVRDLDKIIMRFDGTTEPLSVLPVAKKKRGD